MSGSWETRPSEGQGIGKAAVTAGRAGDGATFAGAGRSRAVSASTITRAQLQLDEQNCEPDAELPVTRQFVSRRPATESQQHSHNEMLQVCPSQPHEAVTAGKTAASIMRKAIRVAVRIRLRRIQRLCGIWRGTSSDIQRPKAVAGNVGRPPPQVQCSITGRGPK